MSLDSWTINGTPLESLAVAVSTAEGQLEAPEWTDLDVALPGRHGVLDVGSAPDEPRRPAGPGRIVFTGWVQGIDPVTGQLVGDGWDAFYRRADELQRAFGARRLVLEHTRPDGTVRRATGWRTGSLSIDRQRTSPLLGTWQATVKIPGAFWSATTDVTISALLASGQPLALGALAVGNAPIPDAIVTFGPGSNPTLVQGGTYVGWDGVISSGRQLAVDTSPDAPEVGPGLGTAWSPADSAIRYGGGSGTWFELDPQGGDPVLNHTGGGQMSVAVTARPRYLTS